MPGILPMKVIKVGTSSQSRIAQACDRCRSKKIRCDGIRPTCSQCSNVGFECRTSDKLSRRAFPRGYTESLEERVRALESENRELKDLLDEKDEKIDMLSKMHGHQPRRTSESPSSPSSGTGSKKDQGQPVKEDTFRVQASPLLLGVENSDSYFMGPSSGRSFIETFKRRLQENGKSCSDFNPEAFLHIQGCAPLTSTEPSSALRIPPRLFTDRCVNVYFQEWAPLFPVLHKPTFLRLYEDFSADADKVKSNYKIAQLYLVFGIASLSSASPDYEQIAACEDQWQKALDAILMENTMNTLQCLVLALMYCSIRADYRRLVHYKGVAVALSHRLGLHQSQKRFSFGALTIETRKKVFWTLYTLDCFSAAMLGLPKVLREEDIHTELPSDCDDEYVTEKGFQPTLPGEYTRISSALALFRLSRILAKVLGKNYPASTSYELSLQQIAALDTELCEWSEDLPTHLKLTFAQDKPSTDVTGSRSPILALAYYHTRILIHRPAIGTNLGSKDAPSLMTISESSKHTVQIVQLLEERGMSFSFCLNRTDILVLCGMTLLYQAIGLKQESKLIKDDTRLVNGVLKILQKSKAPGTLNLKKPERRCPRAVPAPARRWPPRPRERHRAPPPPEEVEPQHRAPLERERERVGSACAAREAASHDDAERRRHTPGLLPSLSRASFDGTNQEHHAMPPRRDHRYSISHLQKSMMRLSPATHKSKANLDYLAMSNHAAASTQQQQPVSPVEQAHAYPAHLSGRPHQTPSPIYSVPNPFTGEKRGAAGGVSPSEWEALLGAMDGGQANVYDAIYGGPAISLQEAESNSGDTAYGDWSPDAWDLSGIQVVGHQSQSVFSLSDESLSSDDVGAGNDVFAGMGGDDFHHHQHQQQQQHNNNNNNLQQHHSRFAHETLMLDGLDLSLV
ncbi:Transcriptional activator protein acu-15 [Apiospora kogelbergensis]|uniref:Transcriptional activator protein acu-15 n=1 Tax=Apiospora kogelbergensis TaxID=1337665 RepID=UPI00312FF24E